MKKSTLIPLTFFSIIISLFFVSCGNNDDNNGNAQATITINDVPFKNHETGASNHFTDTPIYNSALINVELYPASSDETDLFPHVSISIYVNSVKDKHAIGQKLSIDECSLNYFKSVSNYTNYNKLKGGEIMIQNFDEENSTIELKVNNLQVESKSNNDILRLNGTLLCQYIYY